MPKSAPFLKAASSVLILACFQYLNVCTGVVESFFYDHCVSLGMLKRA